MPPSLKPRCHITAILSVLLLGSGCGDLEGDDTTYGELSAALVSTFSNTSPLCPTTTNWGAWSQTPISTWDNDVKPVVQWIINRTGISSSTYPGHSPSIGRAADWRPHSRQEGTQLANWFLANTKSGGTPLGIDYIIWQAQIYLIASGVKQMEDRGSFTQNHCDHIHISFVKSGSVSFAPTSTTPWGTSPDAGATHDTTAKPDTTASPPQADATVPQADPDAGDPPPPAGSDGLGTPPSPPNSSSPPSSLVGGCSLSPQQPGGPTHACWLFLLLALETALARCFRRRRPGEDGRATPWSSAELPCRRHKERATGPVARLRDVGCLAPQFSEACSRSWASSAVISRSTSASCGLARRSFRAAHQATGAINTTYQMSQKGSGKTRYQAQVGSSTFPPRGPAHHTG